MAPFPSLIIRPAGPEDLDILVDFSAAMAKETENLSLDRDRLRLGISAVLQSPARGFYRVAERQDPAGRLVLGQLMVTYEWSDWRNATFWWIQSVYVHPTARRQGIYRRLHNAVLEEAEADGHVCGVRLYVERENHIAQTAYHHVGLASSTYLVFEKDFIFPQRHESRSPSNP